MSDTDIHHFRGNNPVTAAVGRGAINLGASLPIAALAAGGAAVTGMTNIIKDSDRKGTVTGILVGSAIASIVFPTLIGLAQGAHHANEARGDHEALAQENQYLKGKLEGKTELTDLMLDGRLVEPTEIVIEIGE